MTLRIGIGAVWVAFVGLTVWAVLNGGSLSEVLSGLLGQPWGVQVTLDLVLALSIVCAWMWADARRRGRSALPWIIGTVCTGSIAPLLYLILRPSALPGEEV